MHAMSRIKCERMHSGLGARWSSVRLLPSKLLANKLRRADPREHKDDYWLNQVVALPQTGEDFLLGVRAAVLRSVIAACCTGALKWRVLR